MKTKLKYSIALFTATLLLGCSSGNSPFESGSDTNPAGILSSIPDQDSFTIGFENLRVEGWSRNGSTSDITVRVADRNNFPVDDGTAVHFKTNGGAITSGCTTTDGSCTVTWTAQNPRPTTAGRVGDAYILAYTLGEESFVDTNGDDLFDAGDTFNVGASDLGEAFVDADGDGNFDPTEDELVDINGNLTYDAGDGMYNGPRCQNGAACTATGIHVRQGGFIIMSDSVYDAADLSFVGVSDAGNTTTLTFTIRDLNDNLMPEGTTLALTVTNGTMVNEPDFQDNSTDYSVDVTWGAAAPFAIEIKTTSPAGDVTTVQVAL